MLTIRLTRKGKKNQPFFRLIVTDKRNSPKGGRPVEILGYVDPLTKKKSFEKERILYWLSKGAKPSATVHNLLVQEKVIEGKKINVSKINKSKLAKMAAEKAKVTPASDSIETPAPVETPVEPVQNPEPPPTAANTETPA